MEVVEWCTLETLASTKQASPSVCPSVAQGKVNTRLGEPRNLAERAKEARKKD